MLKKKLFLLGKVESYHIVESLHVQEVVENVNKNLKNGFILAGPPSVVFNKVIQKMAKVNPDARLDERQKVSDYAFIVSGDRLQFEREMNRFNSRGYVPYGDILTYAKLFVQAMIKF